MKFITVSPIRYYLRGKLTDYPVGTVLTEAAYRRLPSNLHRGRCQAYTPVHSADDVVKDTEVLDFLLNTYAAHGYIEGSYSVVWGVIAAAIEVVSPFCHFRALQIARVGRNFEEATGVSFLEVCPDLKDFAGSWTSDLAA